MLFSEEAGEGAWQSEGVSGVGGDGTCANDGGVVRGVASDGCGKRWRCVARGRGVAGNGCGKRVEVWQRGVW